MPVADPSFSQAKHPALALALCHTHLHSTIQEGPHPPLNFIPESPFFLHTNMYLQNIFYLPVFNQLKRDICDDHPTWWRKQRQDKDVSLPKSKNTLCQLLQIRNALLPFSAHLRRERKPDPPVQSVILLLAMISLELS